MYLQGAAIFSGDWKGVGEAAANLFGFSKSVSAKTEFYVMKLDPILEKMVNKLDPILGCPLKQQTWEECKRTFFVKHSCTDRKSQEYPEKECAKSKAELIEKLKEDAELADQQEKCKQLSLDRNQGLQFVNESQNEELAQKLNPSMESTNLNLGLASAVKNGKCQSLPFTVNVQTLASGTKGLAGEQSREGTSSSCVDFSNPADLGNHCIPFLPIYFFTCFEYTDVYSCAYIVWTFQAQHCQTSRRTT